MKRETGENPVRTRHRVLQAEATDPLGEPGREQMCQSNKPGDLPFAVQERKSSGHEELAVRKKNLFTCIKMVFPALMVKETSITVKRFWYP